MWGSRLRVVSRPFVEGEVTRVLEFEGGLGKRPLLRPAMLDEKLNEGGTRVRVWLDGEEVWEKMLRDEAVGLGSGVVMSFVELVGRIAPALDVSVDVLNDAGERVRVVDAGDWKSIDAALLLKRVGSMNVESLAPKVRPIYGADGECVGRACVVGGPGREGRGVVVVGGLRARYVHDLAGVIWGSARVASRSDVALNVGMDEMSRWATQQAHLWAQSGAGEKMEDIGASVVCFGGDPGVLPIAWIDGKLVDVAVFKEFVSNRQEVRAAVVVAGLSGFKGVVVFDFVAYQVLRRDGMFFLSPLVMVGYWIATAWGQQDEFVANRERWYADCLVTEVVKVGAMSVPVWIFRRPLNGLVQSQVEGVSDGEDNGDVES